MKPHRLIALVLIPIAEIVFAENADISIRKTGSDSYELTLNSSAINDVAAGQKLLANKARELCGALPFVFGRYKFERKERLSDEGYTTLESFRLMQQITCGSSISLVQPKASSPSGSWSPSAEEKEAVEKATYRYLTTRSAGPYAEAYEFRSAFMKESAPFESWSKEASVLRKKRGQIASLLIKKITWYKDPPSASAPGVYAASDYANKFQDGSYLCGYIAWYKKEDGAFEIVREEFGVLDAAVISHLTESQLETEKSRFGC